MVFLAHKEKLQRAQICERRHLSYYHCGQGHTAYVGEEQLESARQALQNYRKFQELCKTLIDYSLELAILTDDENGS